MVYKILVTCFKRQSPLEDENILWLPADVAKALGVTPSAVRAAADDGRLETAGRTVGGVRYFTTAAVNVFVPRLAAQKSSSLHDTTAGSNTAMNAAVGESAERDRMEPSYRAALQRSDLTGPLLYRLRPVLATTGYSRSTLYLRVQQRLWTTPIKLGARAVAWPRDEVAALIRARIAGVSEEGRCL